MPPELLEVFQRELPRIEAEERLAAISDGLAASGRMRRRDHANHLAGLHRQLGSRRSRVRARTPGGVRQAAAAAGIAVRVVRRSKERRED